MLFRSISKHKNITKKFIEEFQDFIIWEQIKLCHNFDKSYFNKFKNVNWKIVNERVKFIREYSKYIAGDYYFKDEWLIIDGNLNLGYNSITKLPDNLKVNGWLDIYDTKITKLPDNLKVGGYLDIQYTSIFKLPDNLEVGGILYN